MVYHRNTTKILLFDAIICTQDEDRSQNLEECQTW